MPGNGHLCSIGTDDLTDDNEAGFNADAVHAEIQSGRIAGEVRSAAN